MNSEGKEGSEQSEKEERKKKYTSQLKELREEAKRRLVSKPPESQVDHLPPPPGTQITTDESGKKRSIPDLSTDRRVDKNKWLASWQEMKKRRNSSKLLKEAIEEYKIYTHTPEVVTKYWQDRWKAYGCLVNSEIKVPPCDRPYEEIVKLEISGRKLIYVPKELTTPEGLVILGKMHPKMGLLPYKIEGIVNKDEVSGWVDVEAVPLAENREISEKELLEKSKKEGRMGMDLATYIIASQDSKDLTGEYFDETGWCRLLGSSKNDRTLGAGFKGDLLQVDFADAKIKDFFLGSRSIGVKKAPLTT